jgi:hypothetical protein
VSTAIWNRIRWYSFAICLLSLAILVGLAVVGLQRNVKDSWDVAFILMIIAMIASATVFSTISWRLAYVRLVLQPPGERVERRFTRSGIFVVGAAILFFANAGLVWATGGVTPLQLALGVLVVVLLVLVQRGAQRH